MGIAGRTCSGASDVLSLESIASCGFGAGVIDLNSTTALGVLNPDSIADCGVGADVIDLDLTATSGMINLDAAVSCGAGSGMRDLACGDGDRVSSDTSLRGDASVFMEAEIVGDVEITFSEAFSPRKRVCSPDFSRFEGNCKDPEIWASISSVSIDEDDEEDFGMVKGNLEDLISTSSPAFSSRGATTVSNDPSLIIVKDGLEDLVPASSLAPTSIGATTVSNGSSLICSASSGTNIGARIGCSVGASPRARSARHVKKSFIRTPFPGSIVVVTRSSPEYQPRSSHMPVLACGPHVTGAWHE